MRRNSPQFGRPHLQGQISQLGHVDAGTGVEQYACGNGKGNGEISEEKQVEYEERWQSVSYVLAVLFYYAYLSARLSLSVGFT